MEEAKQGKRKGGRPKKQPEYLAESVELPLELKQSAEYLQLTSKQRVFIEEFLKTGSELIAGERAGYHANSIRKVYLSPNIQKLLRRYWDDYLILNNGINPVEENLMLLSDIANGVNLTNTCINSRTGEVIKTPPSAMERIKAIEIMLKVSGALSGNNQVNININEGGKVANVEYVTAEDVEAFDLSDIVDASAYEIID